MQSTAFYRWMGFGAILIVLLGVVRIATYSNSSSPKKSSSLGQHHGGHPGGGKKPHHHHHGANPSPTASPSPAAGHHHHHATATTAPSTTATAASTQPSTGGGSTSTPTSHPTHTSGSGGGGSSIVTPTYGSYTYATSGGEHAIGSPRTYPSSSKITLAKDGRCVSSTWQPISQHKEVQVVCPAGSTAVKLQSESQTISFLGVSADQDLKCSSTALLYSTSLKAGDGWSFVCKSSDTKASSKASVIGFQTFSIGGKSIKALHVHVVAKVSGSGTGTSTQDYWYAPSLGMLVKIQATTNVKQQGIVYSGHDTLVLSSTKPS